MLSQFTVSDWNLVFNIATAVLLVAALTASYRTIRHRQNDAEMTRELEIWRERAERLDDEVASLETRMEKQGIELREQTESCASKVAHIESQVQAIQEERDSLRKMVVLETVPPALTELADRSRDRIIEALNEILHPIAQGMDRLLTKGGANGE